MKQTVEHEPGTVLPVADDPTRFYVLGSREWWYAVCLGSESQAPSCECEDHTYRRRDCRHIKLAREFVARGARSAADAAVEWFMGLSEDEQKEIWR